MGTTWTEELRLRPNNGPAQWVAGACIAISSRKRSAETIPVGAAPDSSARHGLAAGCTVIRRVSVVPGTHIHDVLRAFTMPRPVHSPAR